MPRGRDRSWNLRSGYGIDPGTLGVWDRSWNATSTGTIPERSWNAQGFRIDPGSLRVFWIDPRMLKPTESVLVGQASFLSPTTRFIYNHARELMRMMYIRWQGTFTLHKNYYSSKVIFFVKSSLCLEFIALPFTPHPNKLEVMP